VGWLERALSVFYVYPFRCQLCSARFSYFQWGVRYFKQEDLRQYERIGVRFPVVFSTAKTVGKGEVTDVTIADCAIATTLPLEQGESLKLELYARRGRPPIVVDRAVVRSVRTGVVGVQFVAVAESERARLNRLVGDMVGVPIARVPESATPVR